MYTLKNIKSLHNSVKYLIVIFVSNTLVAILDAILN